MDEEDNDSSSVDDGDERVDGADEESAGSDMWDDSSNSASDQRIEESEDSQVAEGIRMTRFHVRVDFSPLLVEVFRVCPPNLSVRKARAINILFGIV